MSALRVVLAAAIPLGLCSCTVIPVYTHSDPATAARLNLSVLNSGWLCLNQKSYRLKAGADGYAQIPAGQRVTVGRYFSSQSGNVIYSCNSALSFMPKPGGSYYANFEIAAERCRIEIYQEGAANRIGLALEPTLGPAQYCGKT